MENREREDLLERIRALEDRLEEAEETFRALRSGEVDAVVVSNSDGERIYTLKGADEAYRLLVQNMAEGAVTVTPSGVILFANERFAAMVNAPLERVLGLSIHELVATEDKEILSALLESARHRPRKDELRLQAGGGAFVPAYVSANRIQNDGIECLCLMLTDLTEQRRSEEILASEKLTSSILDHAAEAILVLDPAGKIIRASRAAHRLAAGNVLLRDFDEIFRLRFHGADSSFRHLLSVLQRQGSIESLDSTAVMADGRTLYLLLSAAPLAGPEGEFFGYAVTLFDITDRKRAEDALRESESRERARAAELEAIMDAVPVATYIARDPECRHMIGSRATYELLRLEPGSNLSKSAPMDESPSSFKAVRQGREIPPQELPVQTAASTGHPVRNYEFDVMFGDGTCRNLLGDAVPMFDEHGQTRGAVGAFMDITDRKRSEEQLRQAQKLESVGLLAGGIAHDFNNLLVSVMGNASLLQGEIADESRDKVEAILKASERAADLTRQLLAYAGKGRFSVELVDLSKKVREMMHLLRASIPKMVSLHEALHPGLLPVEADPGQIQQVIMNLVLNAAEAIPDGTPGSVFVRTTARRVSAGDVILDEATREPLAPGEYLCLEVRDTGQGMDEQTRRRIFDPFFTTKFTGRGLGLPAAAGVVKAHHGAIEVNSAVGRGTVFRVFLPAAEKRAVAAEPRGQTDLRGAGTVLVVDDEDVVLDVAAAALRRFGYEVLIARDGREAVRIVEQNGSGISLVLLDLMMPVMGGEEALQVLREIAPGIKVVLMSGYGESEAVRLFSGKDLTAFLQKPFTAARLGEQVKQALAADRRAQA